MRAAALVLVALGFALACSRDAEAPRGRSDAADASSRRAVSPRTPLTPAFSGDAVLAPDGGAPAGALLAPDGGVPAGALLAPDGSAPIGRSTRELVDPQTGEVLPADLVAVLEAGPGGPAWPGEVDLLLEAPLHRGRIPIVLSETSAIDPIPMRPPDTRAREDRDAPGLPRREAFDASPGVPAARAPF